MIPADRRTLQRLLLLVEGHLCRILPGRLAVPSRAYAAARSGAVSVIEFPAAASADDAEATAAILALEMARRDCRLFVLVQGDGRETIHLEGHWLGRHPARAERMLRIEREGRKIGVLRRLHPGAYPGDARRGWDATP